MNFMPREHKIHIFELPCSVLFIIYGYLIFYEFDKNICGNKIWFNILTVRKAVFKLKVRIYNKNKHTKALTSMQINIFMLLAKVTNVAQH